MGTKNKKGVIRQNGAVAIYHQVYAHESFEDTANILFALIKEAHQKYPNKDRILYLDIEGHKNIDGGFDSDMFELQKDFILGFLMQFLAEVRLPLVSVRNNHQINDIPDELNIMNKVKFEELMSSHKEIAVAKETDKGIEGCVRLFEYNKDEESNN